jgi:hypothetical protein
MSKIVGTFTRKYRVIRAVVLVLVGAALFVGAGYLSNAMCKPSCQDQFVTWLSREPLGGDSFYLVERGPQPDIKAALGSIDAPYHVIQSSSGASNRWPRVTISTEASRPFLIGISYRVEGDWGERRAGTKFYFCFLGGAFELGEWSASTP